MKKQTGLLKLALIVISLIVPLAAIFVVPAIMRATRLELHAWVWPLGLDLYVMLGLVLAAIWPSWRLLQLIDQQAVFTLASVHALTCIKWEAYSVTGFFAVVLPLFYIIAQVEDAPGILLIAIVLTGVALIIGIFASILAQLLASAVQLKQENELTI